MSIIHHTFILLYCYCGCCHHFLLILMPGMSYLKTILNQAFQFTNQRLFSCRDCSCFLLQLSIALKSFKAVLLLIAKEKKESCSKDSSYFVVCKYDVASQKEKNMNGIVIMTLTQCKHGIDFTQLCGCLIVRWLATHSSYKHVTHTVCMYVCMYVCKFVSL